MVFTRLAMPVALPVAGAALVAMRGMMLEDSDAQPAMVELVMDARSEHVAVMRQAAVAAAEASGLDPARVDDVALAVGEASANVVVHAYDGAPGSFALFVYVTPDDLRLVVRDWGAGIRPRPDSPGLGLGLPLIGALADAVEFADAEDGATDVRMLFRRSAAA
jgi:serine/threonine-protein kinase RsbW